MFEAKGWLTVASLIEELVQVMTSEIDVYKQMMPIANEKTNIIIRNDLEELQKITEKEQLVVEEVTALEKRREKVIVNIGTVLNRNPGTLNMKAIIQILEKQPKEQKQLMKIHDELKSVIDELVRLNDKNKKLIESSLEMISFHMNVLQSSRMVQSNTYTRGAATYDATSYQPGMFDAKQ